MATAKYHTLRAVLAPLAAILLQNGKPRALTDISYVNEGGRWKPSKSRVTMFDSTGQAPLVSLNDYSGVKEQTIW